MIGNQVLHHVYQTVLKKNLCKLTSIQFCRMWRKKFYLTTICLPLFWKRNSWKRICSREHSCNWVMGRSLFLNVSGDTNLHPPPKKKNSSGANDNISMFVHVLSFECLLLCNIAECVRLFIRTESCSLAVLCTDMSSMSLFWKWKCPVAVPPKPRRFMLEFIKRIIVLVLVIKACCLVDYLSWSV